MDQKTALELSLEFLKVKRDLACAELRETEIREEFNEIQKRLNLLRARRDELANIIVGAIIGGK